MLAILGLYSPEIRSIPNFAVSYTTSINNLSLLLVIHMYKRISYSLHFPLTHSSMAVRLRFTKTYWYNLKAVALLNSREELRCEEN